MVPGQVQQLITNFTRPWDDSMVNNLVGSKFWQPKSPQRLERGSDDMHYLAAINRSYLIVFSGSASLNLNCFPGVESN